MFSAFRKLFETLGLGDQSKRAFRKLAGYTNVPKCTKCGRFLKRTIAMGGSISWCCRNPKCNLQNQGRLFE